MHTYIHITTHICTYKKLESHYEFPKENTGSENRDSLQQTTPLTSNKQKQHSKSYERGKSHF